MSEDDIDGLIVSITEFIEKHSDMDLDNDALYEELTGVVYEDLEKFITKERNYN